MLPLLCKNTAYLDSNGSITKGHISVKGDTIDALYPIGLNPESDHQYSEVLDASSYLVIPGLMNCHTHIPMVLFRGLGDDLPLSEWLNSRIYPMEERLTSEIVYYSTLLGISEMLHNGCTFFSDMYFFVEDIAKACTESGIKANLSLGLLDFKGDKGIDQSRELYWKLKEDQYRNVSFFLGPHSPYSCSLQYLEKIIKVAEELDTGIHIHLNETLQEVENIQSQYQCRPIELMNQIGLFSRPTIAAHCVHTSENERMILREHPVLVVHNPSSNCKLASGISPVRQYIDMGLRLAIGTDGAASNNQLNLFKEIHLASLLSKVSEMDATAFPHHEFYSLMVDNPSSFFFPGQKPGIQPGGKADLVFIDIHHSNLFPQDNMLSHLLYSIQGNEVLHVMIDGIWVVKNNQITTFDEQVIRKEFSNLYSRLIS